LLNYMALHSAGAAAAWPGLWSATELEQYASVAGATLDPLIAFQPLAGLVNGKSYLKVTRILGSEPGVGP